MSTNNTSHSQIATTSEEKKNEDDQKNEETETQNDHKKNSIDHVIEDEREEGTNTDNLSIGSIHTIDDDHQTGQKKAEIIHVHNINHVDSPETEKPEQHHQLSTINDDEENDQSLDHEEEESSKEKPSPEGSVVSPDNVLILDGTNQVENEEENDKSEKETKAKPLSYIVDFSGPKKPSFFKRLFYGNENAIKTTKYRWWTFLFWSTLFQYKELSNIYFLIIMILACIPYLSPTSPITSIIPVIFILASGLLRDAIQEIVRAIEDRKANRKKARFLNRETSTIENTQAQKIRVGDILYIENHEEIPADILVISSSNESGICYCETSNLDGESNMKLRLAKESLSSLNTSEKVLQIKGNVLTEAPHKLYQFKGKLEVDRESIQLPNSEEKTLVEPLTTQNTMFRGATLQNTDFIFGLVLYTGKKTKLFLNLKKTKSKFSYMQYTLNALFIGIILLNILLNLLITSLSLYQQAVYWQNAWYVGPDLSAAPSFTLALSNCGTTIILLNLMIPMSLYVSLEFVKMLQAWFFNRDVKMFHDGQPMKVYSSNLNTDLAKIDIIFSDKTGTLTENIMEFKKVSSSTKGYDDETLKEEIPDDLLDIFQCIVLCHTIIPNKGKDGMVKYEGESPDEVALVEAAYKYGFELVNRTDSKISYVHDNQTHEFDILAVIPFSSDRKRMSVLVRSIETNTIHIYTKGADSMMIKLASSTLSESIKKNVDSYGSEGLRTLLLGTRVIDEEEYASWSVAWRDAESLIDGREEAMAEAATRIEVSLDILGATGIEDKLQDLVPETVDFFVAAGIQIWMLTGDKMETAINIAGSANMINHDTKICRVLVPTKTKTTTILAQLSSILAWTSKHENEPYAIAIEGNATEIILKTKSSALLPLFLQVVRESQTIICCRSTPLQKSNLVTLAKRQFKKIGLAIGDGANDVSMIQSARVGVGIHGREGSQAARAADFAIGRFYMLKRLLAVHGHYSLYRSSLFIQYSFYKNFCLTLLQIFYCIYNGFTMAVITDSYIIMFYNMIFTLVLPFVMGLFDKDIDEHVLENSPELYNKSKKEPIFGLRTTLWWFFLSSYHAVLVFFVTIYASSTQPGVMGMHSIAFTTASTLNLVVIVKAILELRHHTILTYIGIVFSLISLPIFYMIYSAMTILPYYETGDGYFIAFHNYAHWVHWAIVFFVVVASAIPDVAFKIFKLFVRPSTVDRIRMQHLKAGFVVKVPKDTTTSSSKVSASNDAPTSIEMQVVDDASNDASTSNVDN